MNNFIEQLSNLSKTRKFPTYGETHDKKDCKGIEEDTNKYFVYDLSKENIGKYLNTWFKGTHHTDKSGKIIHRSELWTVKQVDKDSMLHLYNRKYNPISLIIMCPVGGDKSKEYGKLYNMKSQIHSIDDSSYGIWWNNLELSILYNVQKALIKFINTKPDINGDEFINYCLTLYADKDSVDYN
jgi:hypothetical protein